MKVTRREFLVGSGTFVGGLALSSLGIDLGPIIAYADEMKKIDKVKSAKQSYIHLLLLCGGLRLDLQHGYEDGQNHQHRRRSRASHQ